MLCTTKYHLSRRDNGLVIPGEEVEEETANTSIRNEENTNERGTKLFAWSKYHQPERLTTDAAQQISSHHLRQQHLIVYTYRGHQYVITNTNLKDLSRVRMSHPKYCLHTCSITASGMADGAGGPVAPSHAPHRDTGSYVMVLCQCADKWNVPLDKYIKSTWTHSVTIGVQDIQMKLTLLEMLSVAQLVKKFPVFYGTQRFITVFTKSHHSNP